MTASVEVVAFRRSPAAGNRLFRCCLIGLLLLLGEDDELPTKDTSSTKSITSFILFIGDRGEEAD